MKKNINKKWLKISKIFVIICIILIIGNICYATNIIDPEIYKPEMPSSSQRTKNIANNILSAITIIGIVVSVVSLIAIGIKYMLGSVEERSEYKKTALKYIIGAILLFSGSTIVQIIYQFTSDM